MSPRHRKSGSDPDEIRTNLEVFVLAGVGAGLDTAYDLNRFADLSVGATLPLLARLETAGLLRSKRGPRRSKQYSLTRSGQSGLQRSWRDLLAPVPREFEAILRAAYMAGLLDPSLKTTRRFLKAAAKDRKMLADDRQHNRLAIEREAGNVKFGRGHRWLRAHSDSIRLEAESRLLSKLASSRDLAELLGDSTWVAGGVG
jgi:DNA-binding PadR family transcriptional regulator